MTQETLNYIINTIRTAVHGAQGPKITLPKPLVEILTGTVPTHCFNKISSSFHPGVHSCNQITYPKRTSEDFLLGELKHFPFFKTEIQDKHKLHTQMMASKETNEPVHKSGKGPTTLSSLQQVTPLKYKTNWLILEKKPQTERK